MFSKNLVWFAAALVAIILIIGGWLYFMQPAQGLNVNLALTTNPATVFAGNPFTLSVALANDSSAALNRATISLVLPANVSSIDSPNLRVVSQSLGNVDANGVSHETFNLIASGVPNTVAHFTANLTYTAAESSAQFQTQNSADVPIGQPAIGVNISAPANVFSGQNFPITVTYNNNTNQTIASASIAMQYPPAFIFSNASTSLKTNGSNSWSLGTLAPNASGAFTVNGNIVGPNGASYPIGALVSQTISGQTYSVVNPTANVTLSQSPLSFSISANNAQNYISSPGDTISYLLSFTNNASVAFQNVVINAKLVGAMFNFSTLQTGGSFNSVNNTVSWNGGNTPQLLSLAPGQSGSVSFHVRTQNGFPIRLLSDKNYALSVSATLASPTVPPGTEASTTISVTSITTKLGGNIVLNSEEFWHDATQGFSDTGPYPPKVNQATQYTIHWLLTNYATDADNVTISAYLQSGTTCTGISQAPASTTFSCDPSNGLVTWVIPVVAATTGVTGKPLQAIFQVQNTPAVNEVGQAVTLIGPASLTATDGFTGAAMSSGVTAMSTLMVSDAGISGNNRLVTQ